MVSRRAFLKQSSALVAAAAVAATGWAAPKQPFRMGCHAITWGGKDEQAIREIGSLGFRNIQLRANTFKDFGDDPARLKALLEAHDLRLAMFSSGNVEVSAEKKDEGIAMHVRHAGFIRALDGVAFQMTNTLRQKGQAPTPEQLRSLAAVMNDIGKRTADLGIQACYHNHMGQWGETPDEVDTIVQALDPRYVKLLFDIAHYTQGGGNALTGLRSYRGITHTVHLKDLLSPHPDRPADAASYQFVPMGEGNRLDLPGILALLGRQQFKGCGIIELDYTSGNRSPLECTDISVRWLKERGYRLS